AERQEAFEQFINTYHIKQRLNKIDPELRAFCSEEQIREMANSPLVEIGSHTHRHYNLSRINPGLVEEELSKSKRMLEQIIEKPVLSIGYPDGDYSENVKDITENAGYKYQLAVSFLSSKDHSDPRIRSRYSVSNSTDANTNKIMINRQFSKNGF
ncbi:MAG: polysaccharide deacetylase family protein, partial [Bacteroidia bacterium]|nr:polysaccharide deacetylase family protein [Bacteroidia bacterium]